MSSKRGAFKESEATCDLRVASGSQEFLEKSKFERVNIFKV
jgi:hypothetical protein